MASIYKFNASGRTSVYISFQNSTFLLCSLTPEKIEQQVIDLTCLQGESITLISEGPNTIHLMGNYVTQEGVDDDIADREEKFLGINNVNLHQGELVEGSDQEDDYQDVHDQDDQDIRKESDQDIGEQEDNQKSQNQPRYTLRKRKQKDNCIGNGTESNDLKSSNKDNTNKSENEEDKLDEYMPIDNNDTIDPIQQTSPMLVTKKNYVDFDESDSFESGTDSVIDELDVPHLQYLASIPDQISEPVNHSKALDASNLVQNDQNTISEIESDLEPKVTETKSEIEYEELDSSSRDGQLDMTQEEPTNNSDRNSEVNQDSAMNESDNASQSSPLLPATNDELVKTPVPDKKKAAKSNQPKAKPTVHPEKQSSDKSNKTSKKSKKENTKQNVKKSDKTKNDSTNKTAQTLKTLSKKERKRLAKQNLQKEKEKTVSLKKKKKTEPIHGNSNNQIPRVIAVASKAIKKNDTSKSIPEGKATKAKPKSKTTKTENSVKDTNKKNAHDKERLEDKPVAAEKSSLTEEELVTKATLTLDSKLTNSPNGEVPLDNVKNDINPTSSPSEERTSRYPRRAIGAESKEKLRMMAAADASIAKSISRERGRNKKRALSVPPDTRPTKKHTNTT